MDFEGHRFKDLDELERELRASWPGVWVEPREGGDPLPFTWALRLGDQNPGWQPTVVMALTDLVLDADNGIAFGAIESLRAAPWDVGATLATAVADRLDAFAARASARITNRSALSDIASLLALSPAKGAMPARLAGDLVARTSPRDGFPETAFVAVAMDEPVAATAATERLVDWIVAGGAGADAGAQVDQVDQVLAQGVPVSERIAQALAARDPALAARFAAEAKQRLEAAAASLEASLKNPDYPAALKQRMLPRRGSHAKRWAALASALGVPAGRFKA